MVFYLVCMEGLLLEDWGFWLVIFMVDGFGVWLGKGVELDMFFEDRDCRDRDFIIVFCKAFMDILLFFVLFFVRDEVLLVLYCVVISDIKEVLEEFVGREFIDGDWVFRFLFCDDDWVLVWLIWLVRLFFGMYRGLGRGELE